MNHVTGYLISPRRPPLQGLTVGPAPSPFYTPFFSILARSSTATQRPRLFASIRFRGLSCRPVITCRLRYDSLASSSSIDLCGCWTRRPSLERKGRGGRGLTLRHRRQAAPLVSAVHGCYKHSAVDGHVFAVVIAFCVSVSL